MPKKGKGKKKGGKGKEKKEDGPPPLKVAGEEEPLSELSRQFYMVQIKDLEERVGRYQERCAGLQVSNEELQSKLAQQEEDQGQVIQFLKKKTKDQALSAATIEGELETLRRAREEEREQLEAQISQQEEDARRAQDKLQEENGVLQGKLDALEEFRVNKERLEEESREMAADIERLKKEKEDVVYSLEKKAVLDRDKMKREMVSKVNMVAGEFRKVSDLQMVETTKRTIRENVTIGQQLSKMSEKTMALLRENEALRRKETEMSRRVELLETSHREVTRSNVSNQKVILLLQEKARGQERELEDLRYTATQCVKLERQAQQAMEQAATTTIDSKIIYSPQGYPFLPP
ncbi:Cilia- and flagella-associated protein 157 [Geodia barretti]|uniref:Cilia- and flagella-associated protein 157 n=1 Tax=Geodia barretti TaxID=519541 RepID=A0AA35X969_GEOBA|nr:Cilia- and flagella-associated protein 157 [Geodia barretti]